MSTHATIPSLAELMAEIAAALSPIADQIEGLQIVPFLNFNPTPPSLDVYPGDPFQIGASFTAGDNQLFFTVRARASTSDQQAGQELLMRMLDTADPAAVEVALAEIGLVVPSEAAGVSGFREYLEDAAANGRLLGCEWRVTTFL